MKDVPVIPLARTMLYTLFHVEIVVKRDDNAGQPKTLRPLERQHGIRYSHLLPMASRLYICSYTSSSADEQSPNVTIYRVFEGTSVLPSILVK